MPLTLTSVETVREPSAAGALTVSTWVIATPLPTNLRAMSGTRSAGTVRSVVAVNSAEVSPETEKLPNSTPTSEQTKRAKSSLENASITCSTFALITVDS